jgi:hypothetical protein
MIKTNKMRVSNAIEFYLLEYMVAESDRLSARNLAASDKFKDDLIRTYRLLESNLSTAFLHYLYLAAIGEARHASCKCEYMLYEINGGQRDSACEAGLDYDIEYSLPILEELYLNCRWFGGSFGGSNWGEIVQCAQLYYTIGCESLSAWIDYIMDVEHNGGSLFDKKEAGYTARLKLDMDKYPLRVFLNFKFDHDILEDVDSAYDNEILDIYMYAVSSRVKSLIHRFYVIYKEQYPPSWLDKCNGSAWYDYTPVKFGSRVLTLVEARTLETCESCGTDLECIDTCCAVNDNGYYYCNECYHNDHISCEGCNEYFDESDTTEYDIVGKNYTITLCSDCANEAIVCWYCDSIIMDNDFITDDSEDKVCLGCARDNGYLQTCANCHQEFTFTLDYMEAKNAELDQECPDCAYWTESDVHPYLDTHDKSQLSFYDLTPADVTYYAGEGYTYRQKVINSWKLL